MYVCMYVHYRDKGRHQAAVPVLFMVWLSLLTYQILVFCVPSLSRVVLFM
jgi:hypothetical protein